MDTKTNFRLRGEAVAILWLGSNPAATKQQFELLGREYAEISASEELLVGWMSVWSKWQNRSQHALAERTTSTTC